MYVLASCCTPYYAVDPLQLNLQQIKAGCPLSLCGDNEENCSSLPWTNIEYNYGVIPHWKFGQYYFGYSNQFMLSGGVNWLYSSNGTNGFSLDFQTGLLKYKGYFTTFPGIEYNRYNKNGKSQNITPYIGFSFPARFINTFQFKLGYHQGLHAPTYSGLYTALSIKLPLANLIF